MLLVHFLFLQLNDNLFLHPRDTRTQYFVHLSCADWTQWYQSFAEVNTQSMSSAVLKVMTLKIMTCICRNSTLREPHRAKEDGLSQPPEEHCGKLGAYEL